MDDWRPLGPQRVFCRVCSRPNEQSPAIFERHAPGLAVNDGEGSRNGAARCRNTAMWSQR